MSFRYGTSAAETSIVRDPCVCSIHDASSLMILETLRILKRPWNFGEPPSYGVLPLSIPILDERSPCFLHAARSRVVEVGRQHCLKLTGVVMSRQNPKMSCRTSFGKVRSSPRASVAPFSVEVSAVESFDDILELQDLRGRSCS